MVASIKTGRPEEGKKKWAAGQRQGGRLGVNRRKNSRWEQARRVVGRLDGLKTDRKIGGKHDGGRRVTHW